MAGRNNSAPQPRVPTVAQPERGSIVLKGETIVGRVTFIADNGMVAIETMPTKPRPKNWLTAKEIAEAGYSFTSPPFGGAGTNPPG